MTNQVVAQVDGGAMFAGPGLVFYYYLIAHIFFFSIASSFLVELFSHLVFVYQA